MPRNSQIIHHQEFANALQDDVQFDLDSGTICRRTSDNRMCRAIQQVAEVVLFMQSD